jgi:hypothetical protein
MGLRDLPANVLHRSFFKPGAFLPTGGSAATGITVHANTIGRMQTADSFMSGDYFVEGHRVHTDGEKVCHEASGEANVRA